MSNAGSPAEPPPGDPLAGWVRVGRELTETIKRAWPEEYRQLLVDPNRSRWTARPGNPLRQLQTPIYNHFIRSPFPGFTPEQVLLVCQVFAKRRNAKRVFTGRLAEESIRAVCSWPQEQFEAEWMLAELARVG